MECRMISYVVSESRGVYGQGQGVYSCGVAATRCETHNYDFGTTIASTSMCPIGRIEQATEEAIAKIKAETLAC